MVKLSLKNFGKNLIYVFIPMGIVYLFLLLAVFSLIGSLVGAAGTAFTEAANLIGESVELSQTSVTDFLSYSFQQINWNDNPFKVIKSILDTKWLSGTIKGFFNTLNQSVEGFDEKLDAIVNTFKGELKDAIIVAAVLIVLGLTAANYATRYAMRNRVAKRNVKQFVIAHTLVPLFETVMMLVSLVLLATIKFYSLLVFVAIVMLMGTVSICTSYLIYRDGNIKLKQVLTWKTILQYSGVLAVIFLVNIALAAGLWLIDPILSILLVVPICIYSANIVDVNTDSYMVECVANNAAAPQPSAEEPTEEQTAAEQSATEQTSAGQPTQGQNSKQD